MNFDIVCPECEWSFSIEEPHVGEIIRCQDCNLNLKVMTASEAGVKVELTDTNEDDWGQ